MKYFLQALALSLICAPHILTAQYNAVLLQSPENSFFSAESIIHSGANTLTNKDFFRLRQGGYLTADEINNLEGKLRNENIVGGYYSFDLVNMQRLRSLKGRPDTLFLVSAMGYHQFQEALIPKAAAQLALHGNLQFEGMTVDLAPFRYQMQKYHQWKLGLMQVTTRSSGQFYAGFTAGINLGMQQMSIDVKEATLYTAPFGEYLSLESSIHFSRSAPEPFSVTDINGIGPALDFFYAWIPSGKGPQIAISFTQLGFIMWNKESYSYHRDTVMKFEGMIVDNLFNMDDSWNDNLSLDTLDRLFHRVGEPHRHYSSLPITINLSVRQPLNHFPMAIRTSFIYKHQTLMKPMLEMALEWNAGKSTEISRSLYIGGYNGVCGGWKIRYTTKNALKIWLGSHDLYQTLSGNTKVSLHVYAGISYQPSYAGK
jgi:hypothetical protein